MSLDPLSDSNTAKFIRSDLEQVGFNPRAREILETLPLNQDALTQEVAEIIDEVNLVEGSAFIVWDAPLGSKLTDARLLVGSTNVDVAPDTSDVKIDLKDTGVTAGTVGSPSKLVVLAIDAKGRITSASQVDLQSGNVTETSNLYFTTARARSALSAGSHIGYNSGTGVVSFNGTGVSGTFASPTSITVADGLITAIS
jgi:hypothetical protein